MHLGSVPAPDHAVGVLSQLAALELLVFPSLSEVVAIQTELSLGLIEVTPFVAPVVVLTLAPGRFLAVRLMGYEAIEQEYDAGLVPLRATVRLWFRVVATPPQGPAIGASRPR